MKHLTKYLNREQEKKILNKNKKQIVSGIVIILAPILNIYRMSIIPVGVGDMALFVVVFVWLFVNKGRIRGGGKHYFVNYYAVFFVLALISMLIRGQENMGDFIQKWIKIAVFVCIFDVMARTEFDFGTMCKWCIRVGMILSLVLLIQVLLNTIFHIQITPYLNSKWFPLYYGDQDTVSLIQIQRRWLAFDMWRASSVFAEPAGFAQFILLPLTLAIFWEGDFLHRKKGIICAIIFTIAIFLGKSANGIIISLIVWVIFIMGSFKSMVKRSRFVFIAAFMVIAVVVISQTNYMSEAWERVETLAVVGGSTTANQRFLQGIAIFAQLPTAAQWLGIGFGNVEAFLTESHITTAYLTDVGNEYMNGFSTVLVSGGIVGLILFLFIWFRLFFENKSSVSRVLLVVISILFCTSSVFYSCLTVYYLVFIRCKKDVNIEETEEKYAEKNHAGLWHTARGNKNVPAG